MESAVKVILKIAKIILKLAKVLWKLGLLNSETISMVSGYLGGLNLGDIDIGSITDGLH
ncbi:MAG: hypothetical protein IJL26_04655 [Clostridia bacterium]|nr:hypothetical protein [Clostridia bacterium]